MITEINYMPDIAADALAALDNKRQPRGTSSNRASALDDPCERRLVYYRTISDKQGLVPTGLQGIFETGNELEPVIERILSEIGHNANPRWRIIQSQSELIDNFLRRYNITGHIDGLLQVFADGDWITVAVVDIKTCSPNVWDRLDDYESLDLYPWTRKWRGQLMIYALGKNVTKCLILAVNKQNLYEVKPIWFDLNMEYAEQLVKKAESVNKHVDAGTLPDKINIPSECARCSFAHICLPDLVSTGNLELLTNDEIAELLGRREELKESKAEYDSIERRLKGMLIEGQDIICGDFIIQWSKISRKAYSVEAGTYWKKTVTCTKPGEQVQEETAVA